MSKEISKTQIDRLGDRLKQGNISEDDLRLLDQYRLSFTEAYEVVVGTIRKELGLEPTGRPAKSTTSISDKLRRESIRLTQIQDIAGCRLIVADIANQETVVKSLNSLFERTMVVDRRQNPSHGYRAIHVIVNYSGKLIEIQVRTSLQHLWAELSEKFSDVIDPAIKYGGGRENIRTLLLRISEAVAEVEKAEAEVASVQALSSQENIEDDIKQEIARMQETVISLRHQALDLIQRTMDYAVKVEGEKHDLSD